MLGERHPDTATSLNNLAYLLEAQGDYAAAKPLYEQAVDISRHNLDLAAAAQTERQQMAMADMLRFHLDAFLSAAPRVGIADGASYRQVLAWKGAILERQRRLRDLRRLLRADPRPEVARAAAEWQSVVVRLATLALATPGPDQQDAWRRQLADLTERKDQLEEELTRRSAAFRAARAEARRTPEQLQAALPRDAALIDVLEYTHSSPPPERKGKLKRERRLVAFVVRPDRPIARVELGPLEPIRAAIDAWRPILRGEQPAPRDEPDGPAARLRRLVWSPLEEHLAGVATVLVSPDGALGLVPLGALPGQVAGSYLIEEYTLALVPVPRLFGADGAVAAAGPEPAPARPRRRRCCWSATSITAAIPAWRPLRSRAGRPPGTPAPGSRRSSSVRKGCASKSQRFATCSRTQFPETRATLLRRRQGDGRGPASDGRQISLCAPGHARLFRPAGTPLGVGAERPSGAAADGPLRRRGSRRVPSGAALGPGAGRGQRPAHPARQR